VIRELLAARSRFSSLDTPDPGPPRPVLVCGRKDPAGRVREVLLAGGGEESLVQAFALRRLRPDDSARLEAGSVVVYGGEVTQTLDADTRGDLAVAGAAGRPLVAVLEGLDDPAEALIEAARTPGLPPSAVVGSRRGRFPEQPLLRAVAERAGRAAPALAAALPALRKHAVDRAITQAARRGGTALVLRSPKIWEPTLPAFEVEMVLEIAACYGYELSPDRAVELAGTLAAGLGMGKIARDLAGAVPVAGRYVRGSVSYSGTRALGWAASEYFSRGAPADVERLRELAAARRAGATHA
jgi:uncharacterized protein (DUF697 family)